MRLRVFVVDPFFHRWVICVGGGLVGCMLDEQTRQILMFLLTGVAVFVSLYLQECGRKQGAVFNTAPPVSPSGGTSRVDR